MKKININSLVKVKLTERGMYILENSIDAYRINSDWYENGVLEIELWNLINIFGDYMYNGCTIPFEQNIIYIKDEDIL